MKKLVLLLLSIFCLSANAQNQDTLVYHPATKFSIIGRVDQTTESPYDRLPAFLKDSIRKELWDLGKNTSGVAVRFSCDSKRISIRWTPLYNFWMNHMTPTGIKGLDLYTLKDGKWLFLGSARPGSSKAEFTSNITSGLDGTMREYMLYLPLYDGVSDLKIGVYSGSQIQNSKVNSPSREKPVVVYGTSVTQGGCATRAGMSYTSILSRMLDREFINLGFSGNGRLDYEVADVMTKVENPSCFVMDMMGNCTKDQLDRLPEFVRILRSKHPHTPILMLGNIDYTQRIFDSQMQKTLSEKDARLVELYQQIRKTDKNIHYLAGKGLAGDDLEGMVDGVHFTDLGFLRMTENMYPIVKKLIKD